MELTTSAFNDLGSPEYTDSITRKLNEENTLHKKTHTLSTSSSVEEDNVPFKQDDKKGRLAKAKDKMSNIDVRSAFTKAAAVVLIGGAIGGVGYGGASAVGSYYTEKTVTATVLDKGITTSSTSDDKGNTTVTSTYMIYTDKGVFTDKDGLVKWKFNSSDMYGQLQKGQTYKFTVHGWRNHFLSIYPNIDSAAPAAAPSSPAP